MPAFFLYMWKFTLRYGGELQSVAQKPRLAVLGDTSYVWLKPFFPSTNDILAETGLYENKEIVWGKPKRRQILYKGDGGGGGGGPKFWNK
jgi:hypothetical protein